MSCIPAKFGEAQFGTSKFGDICLTPEAPVYERLFKKKTGLFSRKTDLSTKKRGLFNRKIF